MVTEANDSLAKNVIKNGMTIDKNVWTDLVESQLGVKIKYKWISKSDDENRTKIDLDIAAGDISDILFVTDITKVKQMASAGMLADLGAVYDKYASPLTKKIMGMAGKEAFLAGTYDGVLCGIPYTFGGAEDNTSPLIWLRYDWMKKLGLSEPKTMAELVKILNAFAAKDPDGNGKKDTVGLTAFKDLWGGLDGLEGFFNGYHAYPTIWVADSAGKLVYGGIQSEALKALKGLNALYRSGALDPEFGIKSQDKANELLVGGKAGAEFGAGWNPVWPLFQSHDKDNSVEWKAFRIPSADGKPVLVSMGSGVNGMYVVRKDYKHPEVLVQLLNLWFDKVYGERNEFEKYSNPPGDQNWEVWRLAPVAELMSHKNYNYTLQIIDALKSGDTSKMNAEAKGNYDRVVGYMKRGEQNNWSWATVFGPGGGYAAMKPYFDGNCFMVDKFVTAPTKTMEAKWATLTTMQNESYIKIIMGQGDPDKEFAAFVSNFKKLGGDQIIKEVNDWYSSLKK
jgi:putative aldouronate transport system substrate-binding protein